MTSRSKFVLFNKAVIAPYLICRYTHVVAHNDDDDYDDEKKKRRQYYLSNFTEGYCGLYELCINYIVYLINFQCKTIHFILYVPHLELNEPF